MTFALSDMLPVALALPVSLDGSYAPLEGFPDVISRRRWMPGAQYPYALLEIYNSTNDAEPNFLTWDRETLAPAVDSPEQSWVAILQPSGQSSYRWYSQGAFDEWASGLASTGDAPSPVRRITLEHYGPVAIGQGDDVWSLDPSLVQDPFEYPWDTYWGWASGPAVPPLRWHEIPLRRQRDEHVGLVPRGLTGLAGVEHPEAGVPDGAQLVYRRATHSWVPEV